jgi:hypothetical protein
VFRPDAVLDGRRPMWRQAELESELFRCRAGRGGHGGGAVEEGGVVEVEGKEVWALSAARYLNELGMICI